MTTIVSPALISDQILHVRDEKSSGTAGGTFTAGAWQTRVLNTVLTNTITGASLGSNQITLPAGAYRVVAFAIATTVDHHSLRVQNITDAATTIQGTMQRSWTNSADSNLAQLMGYFVLASSKTFELQHRCTSSRSTDGFGSAGGFGPEIYADVFITKVG